MASGEIVLLGSRLAVLAVATFFSIMLWSRTRETAWMLMVTGTIASYAEIIFSLLSTIGVIGNSFLEFAGIPFGRIIVTNIPWLFYTAAFVIMVVKNRI